MSTPIPWIALFGALGALLVIAGAYYLIYRAHVNRALRRAGSARKLMAEPRTVTLVCLILALVVLAAGCYLLGYKAAYDRFEADAAVSPAVEIPPLTLAEPSAAQALFDSVLELAASPGDGQSVSAFSLSFLGGEFSYMSFSLRYPQGGNSLMQEIEVNASGQVFTAPPLSCGAERYDAAVPVDVLRDFISVLDGYDWPAGESSSFYSHGLTEGISPDGEYTYLVVENGALTPLTGSRAGRFYSFSYIFTGHNNVIYVYIPA